MEKITAIRIKQPNNTFSDEIPIGVSVQNVNWDSSHNLKQILGDIDIDKGTVQEQMDDIASSFVIDSELSDTSQHPVQNKILKQILDAKADITKIPSKLSDLRNDSGFITQVPVTSVNGYTGAVIIDLSKVDELENRVAALENIDDDDDDDDVPEIEIDSELSNSSLNPVQNKIIKQALDQLSNQFHNISEALNGEETALNRQNLILDDHETRIAYLETNPFGGSGQGGVIPIIVDSRLSDTSVNPVQNKIIKQALDNKANIEDIPIRISDLDNDSNFLTQAPVVSVNGRTGAVNVSEISVAERNMLNNHQSRIISLENSVIDEITIDSELSNSSSNPVQNRVIKEALDNKVNIGANLSEFTNDLNFLTQAPVTSVNGRRGEVVISEISVAERNMLNDHQSRIDALELRPTGSSITIDSEFLENSQNPVQSKVIKQALDNKVDLQMLNTKADMTDIPSNLSDLNNDLNLPTISINEQTNTMVIS